MSYKSALFDKKPLTASEKYSKITKSSVNDKQSWEFSSAGRASALQAEGHRFEPYNSHHFWPGSSVG
ncbi:MAG: hypothetical protein PWQ76_348 [Clostridiales bacterium]|nr:hypothetical protein [Oscillospiraceae bacterium]MDN5378095.1 hypothetical protein [Clostridiales bacterium]